MKTKKIITIFLGLVLCILFACNTQCKDSKAATKEPTYSICNITWSSAKFTITFHTDSEYNMITLLDPYSSTNKSYFHPKKGTATYTFNGLSTPNKLYYIIITYGDNQTSMHKFHTESIPSGKHFRIDLDYNKYLKDNISYYNLKRWLIHLDNAYEAYEELVGDCPGNGATITIVASNEDNGAQWIDADYPNTIFMNAKLIPSTIRRINGGDDWCFGTLHEIGHLFDLDCRWTFNGEFTANFKMAYLFKKFNNNIRVYIENRYLKDKWITNYDDLVAYYKIDYDNNMNSYFYGPQDPDKFPVDGLTYMMLNAVNRFSSWDCVSDAFFYYQYLYPNDFNPTFDKFVNAITEFSPSNSRNFEGWLRGYYSLTYINTLNYFRSQNS